MQFLKEPQTGSFFKKIKMKYCKILFIILLGSCSFKESIYNTDDLEIIKINDSESFIEKDFFELFKVDTIIELQFQEDYYLADIYRLFVLDDAIYALDPMLGNLIRFTYDGKPLNKIGNLGEGPMEMLEIEDFSYDLKNDELLLASSSSMKISRFKPNGEFISNIKLNDQVDMFFYSKEKMAMSLTYYNSIFKNFGLFNINGDSIKTYFPFPSDIFPFSMKMISGHVTKSSSGGFLYNEPASSIIHYFDYNGTSYPKYKFESENDIWPERDKDLIQDFFQTLSTGDLTYLTRYYEESEDFLFFNINIKKSLLDKKVVDPRIGYYDKKNNKCYVSKKFDGLSRIKGPLYASDNMFYCWLSKSRIKELSDSNYNWAKSFSKYPFLQVKEKSDLDTPVLIRFSLYK